MLVHLNIFDLNSQIKPEPSALETNKDRIVLPRTKHIQKTVPHTCQHSRAGVLAWRGSIPKQPFPSFSRKDAHIRKQHTSMPDACLPSAPTTFLGAMWAKTLRKAQACLPPSAVARLLPRDAFLRCSSIAYGGLPPRCSQRSILNVHFISLFIMDQNIWSVCHLPPWAYLYIDLYMRAECLELIWGKVKTWFLQAVQK